MSTIRGGRGRWHRPFDFPILSLLQRVDAAAKHRGISRSSWIQYIQFSILPDAMQACHVYNTLERVMKGPLFEEPLPRKDRIADIEMACKKIIAGIVNPSAFIVTGGNSTSKTIRSMTKYLVISNIFDKVRPGFIRKWKKPIAQTFIQDKWDEIVNRRHIVAHTANALNITRNQLKESIRFSKIFAEQIDNQIRDHTNSILHSSAHH